MSDTAAPSGAYDRLMRRALELAAQGPITGGNPQVGAVLVNDAGEIVAEGWHHGAGTPHAEVDALSKLPKNADGIPDAAGLTAVVTLEPCNHTGRTGPCSVALLAAGVARVVYALPDPGLRSGGGAEHLRRGGVEVIEGGARRRGGGARASVARRRRAQPALGHREVGIDARRAGCGIRRQQPVDHRHGIASARARGAGGERCDPGRHRDGAGRRSEPDGPRRCRRAHAAPAGPRRRRPTRGPG